MIYNDYPKTTKEADENKRKMYDEAVQETNTAKLRMKAEEERRKRLKRENKKRELDEIKRKINLKKAELDKTKRDLAVLEIQKSKNERDANVFDENKIKPQSSYNQDAVINLKKTDKIRLLSEIERLKNDLEIEKRKTTQSAMKKASAVSIKKNIVNQEKQKIAEISAEIKKLEIILNNLKTIEAKDEQDLKNLEMGAVPDKKEIMKKEIEISRKISEEKRVENELDQIIEIAERNKEKINKEILLKNSSLSNFKKLTEEIKRKIESISFSKLKLERELMDLEKQGKLKEQELLVS